MLGNLTLFHWGKSIQTNIKKRWILKESMEKNFLIDPLTTNNAIHRKSLTSTLDWHGAISYFSVSNLHCVKSVRIWSYSGPYFAAFGLNTERYFVSLRIQSECGKMRTRITPNKDSFLAVLWNSVTSRRLVTGNFLWTLKIF